MVSRGDLVLTAVDAVAGLLPTHRQCSIEITNKSTYTLSNACCYVESGCNAEPLPPQIDPSSSQRAVFTKTPNTARGAVGVFTYDLFNNSTQESTEKIAVMFSVPYDFNFYSNWYAVGIFEKSKECNYDLYNQMYNNTDSMFVRGKASGPSLSYKNSQVAILASMSDSYEPVIKVQVQNS